MSVITVSVVAAVGGAPVVPVVATTTIVRPAVRAPVDCMSGVVYTDVITVIESISNNIITALITLAVEGSDGVGDVIVSNNAVDTLAVVDESVASRIMRNVHDTGTRSAPSSPCCGHVDSVSIVDVITAATAHDIVARVPWKQTIGAVSAAHNGLVTRRTTVSGYILVRFGNVSTVEFQFSPGPGRNQRQSWVITQQNHSRMNTSGR